MACIKYVGNLYLPYIFTKTARWPLIVVYFYVLFYTVFKLWFYFCPERLKKNAKKANKEMLCGQNTITPGNAHMSLS